MKTLIRLWHRLVAEFKWLDLRDLQAQRRHTMKLIGQIEHALRFEKRPKRVAELEHALNIERAYLRGIDHCIREGERVATRAAMLARI